VLPEVSQLLRCPCLPSLRSVMLLYHFANPAGAVQSLKEVIESLVLQLLPVKVPLWEVRQQSNLGVGGIRNVPKEIIDIEHGIRLALEGEFPGGNLYGFL